MKTLFRLICFLPALLKVIGAGTDVADDPSPPLYRYLIVIDTSGAMAREKDIALDTVSKLVATGINERIQTGDTFGIWTFADRLNKRAYGPILWAAEQRTESAGRVLRVLRDLKFSKVANMGQVMAEIKQAAKASGSLTVFLVTDGTAPVRGTPFDAAINDVFQKHSAAMRKAKRPFVVAFSAQAGELAAQAVSPGGSRIFIPPVKGPLPDAVRQEHAFAVQLGSETNSAVQPPAAVPPVEQGSLLKTNAPKTLSAAEISEILKQQQMERSNSLAAARAAITAAGVPNAPNSRIDPGSRPAETGLPPVSSSVVVEQPRVAIEVPPSAALPPASAANPVSGGGDKPPLVQSQSAGPAERGAVQSPKPQPEITSARSIRTDDSVSALEVEAPVGSAAASQTATLIPPQPPARSRKYLFMAAVLFVVAGGLGWLLFRGGRSAPEPSLITRSMHDRRQ